MSGRPGTSQLHRISALRASSAIAAGTPRAKSPPPRFSAFHPAHVVASQSLEPCTKSYRAPAQAHISQPIVAQVAHIAHTSNRPRQPPVSGRRMLQYLQLSSVVTAEKSVVTVPVSTSSIASICVQITGISCWSTASGPPPAISPAKPGGSTRSGRV